ncbi:hypothetical protein ACFL6Y_00835 [Elusimicrobiota bacterium]
MWKRAALLGTFVTSMFGVLYYTVFIPILAASGAGVSPDWILGIIFRGRGGLGVYCGARFQKFIPEGVIRVVLGVLISALALKYIVSFFA